MTRIGLVFLLIMSIIASVRADVLVPWGKRDGQLGFSARARETPARGPSALAVAPSGALLIVDGQNQQLVSVRGNVVHKLADLGVDDEDVAAGMDDRLVVYSPLHARASFHDAGGRLLGSLSVPRELRDVEGVTLGPSLRLSVRTSLQETFLIGSPTVPQALAQVLHNKEEGIFSAGDRERFAVTVKNGRAELHIYSGAQKQRSLELVQDASALRLVGVAANVACVLIERVRGSQPMQVAMKVDREARCVDVASGRLVLSVELGAVGLYLPRHELAVGGNEPVLAWMHPEPSGMRIRVWGLK
jgi:hypothetical protein